MAFMKTYRKYLIRAAVAWAACLVLLLLAYWIVLRPQHLDAERLEKTLTEKKELYESTKKAADDTIRTQLNEQIKQLRDRLHDFVSNFEDSANLTFDIGQIANEQKVASFSVKGKEKRKTSAIPDCNSMSESHMNISFASGFHQFAAFVNALERHQPVLLVDEFTIIRSNQNNSIYEVTLDVAAFVKKPREMETADKAPPSVLGTKT